MELLIQALEVRVELLPCRPAAQPAAEIPQVTEHFIRSLVERACALTAELGHDVFLKALHSGYQVVDALPDVYQVVMLRLVGRWLPGLNVLAQKGQGESPAILTLGLLHPFAKLAGIGRPANYVDE